MGIKKIVSGKAKYLKISPTKLRRIANIIRGLKVQHAIEILTRMPHKGAIIILKHLKSVSSNAIDQGIYDPLIISDLSINEGPRATRFQPRARGRMFKIVKRTSHINLSLSPETKYGK
jgi:large subunit ribosomal protein L22